MAIVDDREWITVHVDEWCECCGGPIYRGERALYIDNPVLPHDGLVCTQSCARAWVKENTPRYQRAPSVAYPGRDVDVSLQA